MRAVLVLAIGLFTSSAHAQLVQDDPVEARMLGGMPLVEERLAVTIDGQHASTTLLQVYDNQTGSRTEGRYRLRPGSGSQVEGFAYWNGEKKIVGEVFEKQLAHQVYDRVTNRNRDPGLLEQDGDGAFSFKVFPIEPREKKRIELRWTDWLERRTKTVRYRAPVTRDDAEIVVSIVGSVKQLTSSTHKLRVENISGGVRLRSAGARGSSGELILEWQVDEPDWQPTVFVHPGSESFDGWFATALAAPQVDAKSVAAKDVTIVVDRSGSMNGEPMVHARHAAANVIRLLDKRDRVNVIAFSDEVDPLFAAPQLLDDEVRGRAVAFAERLRSGGGTDIALALKTALGAQDKKPERPRVIVFMTDGQSDVEHALEAARADAGDVRVFTVGLGKDVNRPLLQRIAAQKRGRYISIEQASNIERDVGRLAASIAKPVLVNVSIEVDGATVLRTYPRTLPDVFAEDELLVTGRIRGTGLAKLVIKGLVGGKPVAFTQTVDLGKAPPRPWVGRLWAQSRVDHLLEEMSLGHPKNDEIKNEILELALAYNFVTPYTAFLAIPAEELGEMRDTVMAARERKSKILADNIDAASLREEDPVDVGYSSVAPGDVDDEEAHEGYARVQKHGCAGCTTTSRGDAGLLLVAVVLLLRRRRR